VDLNIKQLPIIDFIRRNTKINGCRRETERTASGGGVYQLCFCRRLFTSKTHDRRGKCTNKTNKGPSTLLVLVLVGRLVWLLLVLVNSRPHYFSCNDNKRSLTKQWLVRRVLLVS
jgi:hypothetical protein